MDLLSLPQPFTLAEFLAAGFSRKMLRTLTSVEMVRRMLVGVYVDARIADSPQLRAAALTKLVPAGAVACRGTSAWLYGVDVLPLGAHVRTPPVELAVPEGLVVPKRAGCRAFSAQFEPRDIDVVHGIAVTGPLRTACDLARYRARPEAVAAMDALAHSGIVKLDEITAELLRWTGERNIARARQVVSLAEPKTESPGESRLRLRIVDAGFPRPEPQIEFFDEGVLVYRLDLGLREQRVGFEYDGEQHATQRMYDEARRAWLGRRGWEILSADKGDVFRDDFALELAVGESLSMTPIRRQRVPGWG